MNNGTIPALSDFLSVHSFHKFSQLSDVWNHTLVQVYYFFGVANLDAITPSIIVL